MATIIFIGICQVRHGATVLYAHQVVGLESEMKLKCLQQEMHHLENVLREVRGEDMIQDTRNYEDVLMDEHDDDYKREIDHIRRRCSLLRQETRETLLLQIEKLQNDIRQIKGGGLLEDACHDESMNEFDDNLNWGESPGSSPMDDGSECEGEGENAWLWHICSTLQDELRDLQANVVQKNNITMDSDSDESLFSDSV